VRAALAGLALVLALALAAEAHAPLGADESLAPWFRAQSACVPVNQTLPMPQTLSRHGG
jgi:hypothetical protein